MKEQYLHFLWQYKRLPFNKLFLTDGTKLNVVETGWYNTDAGPDFFSGKVVVEDVLWSGNIELHVKSSDWYVHKHHHDKAYDNVVLHVVYEHDKEVFVNGRKLPTLVLKPFVDEEHYKRYIALGDKVASLPCAQFYPIPSAYVKQQVEHALFQRLNRKVDELVIVLGDDLEDRNKALFWLLSTAFGGRANKLPFQELTNRLPVQVMLKERWDVMRVEALVLGTAGLLNDVQEHPYVSTLKNEWKVLKQKHNLTEMQGVAWKFSGVRPPNFPTFRLAQMAYVLKDWNWQLDYNRDVDFVIDDLVSVLVASDIHDFWNHHYSLKKKSKQHSFSLSKSTQDLILINAIAPYLVYLSRVIGKMEYIDKAIELLEKINAEKNTVTRVFKPLNIVPKNAAMSQGLIELKNEYCNAKRCLSCKIGAYALNSEESFG